MCWRKQMSKAPLTIDFKLQKEFRDQLIDLDRTVYQQEPYQNQLLIAERRPEAYTIIRRGDQVVGYGLVLPLRKAAFDSLKKGKIWESELDVKCLADRTPAGFYISSIAARPDASERERAMIVGSTVSPPLRINFETVAIPISEAGARICINLLRMTPVWSNPEWKGLGDYIPTLYRKGEQNEN